MFRTAKRIFLATERRFDRWSLRKDGAFRESLRDIALGLVGAFLISLTAFVALMLTLHVIGPATGLWEPLSQGEFEAIQAYHANGQVLTSPA